MHLKAGFYHAFLSYSGLMYLQMIPSFYCILRLTIIRFRCLVIGIPKRNTLQTVVGLKSHCSSCPSSLKLLVSLKCVKPSRKKKMHQSSRPRPAKRCVQKWAGWKLTIRSCTTHFFDFRPNRISLPMATCAFTQNQMYDDLRLL